MNKLKAAFLNIFQGINRRLLVDIILIGSLVFLIYLVYLDRTPDIVKQTAKDNEKIQKRIDSISTYNKSLTAEIISLETNQADLNDYINKNNELIQENNNQLVKLKQLYNEKINSVDSYNVKQLDSFFAKRYTQR